MKRNHRNTTLEKQILTGSYQTEIQCPTDVKISNLKVPIELISEIECFEFMEAGFNFRQNKTFFYIPGTASTSICPSAEKAIGGNLAKILNCRVITILHHLSSQNKYPIPFNDVSKVINYFLHNHEECNINPEFVGIAGYSSGGLLAIQICIQSLQKGKIPFRQILLIAPVTNLSLHPKREHDKDAPWFNEEFFRSFVENYVPTGLDPSLPELSPIKQSPHVFKSFPAVTIIYGKNECLAPDIITFHQLLVNQKVDAKIMPLKDKDHGFPWMGVDYMHDLKERVNTLFCDEVLNSKYQAKFSLPVLVPIDLALFGNPPPFNNEVFVNRKLTNKLVKRFEMPIKKGECAKYFSLCGPGGAGKTQIALFFYYSFPQRYTFRYWFSAKYTPLEVSENSENQEEQFIYESLNLQYKQLAKKIGLIGEECSTKECVEKVKAWFENQEQWLIVYDDSYNGKLLEEYLPRFGGHIIITSRNQDYQGSEYIDYMRQREAKQLVRKILRNVHEKDIIGLIQFLLCFPLAIAQACSYIKVKKISISSYIEHYKKYKAILLQEAVLPPQTMHDSVWITWSMNIQFISDSSRLALDFLYACAYLLPNNIPLNLLQEFLMNLSNGVKREEDYQKIILLLTTGCSILSVHRHLNTTIDMITLHPTLQEVLMSHCEKNAEKEEQILNLLLKSCITLMKTKQIGLLEHMQQLLYHIESKFERLRGKINIEYLVQAYCTLANAQYDLSLLSSVDSAKKAEIHLDDVVSLPYNVHMETKATLVRAYWLQGSINHALSKALEAVAIARRNGDRIHEAKFSHNLAVQYQRQGRLDDAEKCLQVVIHIYHELYEVNHEYSIKFDEALSTIILGYNFKNKNDLYEAEQCVDRAKEIAASLPNTFLDDSNPPKKRERLASLIYDCYGEIYLAKNNKPLAREFIDLALKEIKKIYGEKASHRLIAQNTVKAAEASNSFEEALEKMKEALKMFFEIFTEDNIYILDFYRKCGKILFDYKRQDLSIILFHAYLTLFEKQISAEYFASHHNVIEVKHYIAEHDPIIVRDFSENDLFTRDQCLQLLNSITLSKSPGEVRNRIKLPYFRDTLFYIGGIATVLAFQYITNYCQESDQEDHLKILKP